MARLLLFYDCLIPLRVNGIEGITENYAEEQNAPADIRVIYKSALFRLFVASHADI
jgi:hypothetical protein